MNGKSRTHPEDWPQIESLFHQALELEPEDQSGWLRLHCDNGEIREVVRRMLQGHVTAGSFLAQSPIHFQDPSVDAPSDALVGRQIGMYRVVERIASGGMGTVYRAVRCDDAYEKEVALKVIRLEMSTSATRRYFERERRVLARLDHPFIARLVDGGTTPDGLSYLIMDLIEGEPIDDYAEHREMSVDERLRLFLSVCDAVAYAHRNLIVHGDLKPGNIMVTSEGDPRLLDFGLSRLVEDPLGGATDHTTIAALNGWTPRYASPEQVRGEPIGTSTDIYSLGIILFELLTGRRPYLCDSRSPLEAARIVCESAAPKPSSAVQHCKSFANEGDALESQDAADFSPDARAPKKNWHRFLRGDLDCIVLKALEKDAGRRYPTVELLAGDIKNHLAGLPVQARGPGALYRLSRFLSRNRWAAAAVATVVISLVVGTVVSTASLMREAAAHRAAESEAERAENINRFLVGMLLSVDPRRDGRDVRVVELLDWAAQRLAAPADLSPQVESSLHATLGVAYRALGMYDAASPQLEAALEKSRAAFGKRHRHTAGVMNEVALMRWAQGDLVGAEPLFIEALDIIENEAEPDAGLALTLQNNIAGLAYQNGRFAAAESAFREVIARQQKLFGGEHEQTLRSQGNLALVLRDMNRLDEAEALFREVRDAHRRRLPENHPDLIDAEINYAAILHSTGRIAEALDLMESVLTRQEQALGPDHPKFAAVLHNLGGIYRDLGRLDDADAALRRALEVRRSVLGDEHPDTLSTRIALASLSIARGEVDKGLTGFAEVVEIARRVLPADHWQLGAYRLGFGEALIQVGRLTEARDEIALAARILAKDLGPDHPQTQKASQLLAMLDRVSTNQ